MNSYIIKTFKLTLVLLSVFGCKQNERLDNDFALNEQDLVVKSVNILSGSGSWTTKSAFASECAADTSRFIICDTMMLTAQIDLIGDNSNVDTHGDVLTKGSLISSGSDIFDFKINVFETGSSDLNSSSSLTEAITASSTRGVFACSPSYKWPGTATKVSLISYYPLCNSINGLEERPDHLSVDYFVPQNAVNQPDFCTASDKNIVNSIGNIENNRVINMSHRLTAVGIAINGWNVKVTKVSISGVHFFGYYDMVNDLWNYQGSIGAEERVLDLTNNIAPSDSYTGTPNWTEITPKDGYLMMIPQELTDKAMITITYQGVAGNNDKGVIKAPLKSFTGGKWLEGQCVTYNIQLRTSTAVSSNSIEVPFLAGYTSVPVNFAKLLDPNDVYTFEWSEPWLYVSHGSPKENDATGGFASGWTISASEMIRDGVYFFADSNSPSSSYGRTANVTIKGARTASKVIQVTQNPWATISISTTVLSSSEGWYSLQVRVNSNTDWELTSKTFAFLNLPVRGKGDAYFTVKAKSSFRDRSVVLQAKSLIGDIAATYSTTSPRRVDIIPADELRKHGWELGAYTALQVFTPTREYKWKTSMTYSASGSKRELGYGIINTYNIFGHQTNMPAVAACWNNNGGLTGQQRWFLPSHDEYLATFNIFKKGYLNNGFYQGGIAYWTSEQAALLFAWTFGVDMTDPYGKKTSPYPVKCFRYYSGEVPDDRL